MRTFVKKIYRAVLFLAFALVLGFTLLVFLERSDTKRKKTEPVDPLPIALFHTCLMTIVKSL